MEIRNDYNSFSGRRYQEPHTHHITKCLYEDEHAKSKSMAGGMKQDASSAAAGEKEEQDGTFVYGDTKNEGKRTGGLKKGLGLIRNIWDAMGDEDKAEPGKVAMAGSKTSDNFGTDAASTAIRQGLPYRIVNKWESVREKLKTGLSTALKRFSREDAFSALTDPKGSFKRKRGTGRQTVEKVGRGTRQKSPDILTATLSESHLMDSYSKNGEYCRINENLTYQKSKAAEK